MLCSGVLRFDEMKMSSKTASRYPTAVHTEMCEIAQIQSLEIEWCEKL